MDRPETLTLRQVAREVGVAPASIYSHFADLTALIEHVLKLRYDELGRVMSAAAANAKTPLAELVALCAAYVHWGVDHPGEYRTIVGGAMPEQLAPLNAHGAGEELLNALVDALTRADQRDQPASSPATSTPTTSDAPNARWQAGLILWTGMHGLVSLYNSHGDIPWPPLDNLLTQLLSLHTGSPVARIEEFLPRFDDRLSAR